MSDWEISLLIGIALTYAFMGLLVLIGRFEDKKNREEREQEGGA